MGFHVTSGGLIHRPDKDVLVSCLFAGKAVECTRRERSSATTATSAAGIRLLP